MSTAPKHPMLDEAVALLSRLIATPSHSREEGATADIWEQWLRERGADVRRHYNNVYAFASDFNPGKPILLLNSHHDTVKPAASYTRNPYSPDVEDGRLYGLGSNDAGASCVSLACTFVQMMNAELPVNLLLAITAEEEVTGAKGMSAFLAHVEQEARRPDMAIVGEPTGMHAAVAERGLMVIDAVANGVSGHAARNEGVNAVYLALEDVERLRNFSPERVSEVLGPIGVNVTVINGGTQHNVVPDRCSYIVDVRTTDDYSNAETLELLQNAVRHSSLAARSTRLHASVISEEHPLVRGAVALGRNTFVSPTLSDRSVMYGIPALKMGPGQSSRSHTADEYIEIEELNEALHLYPKLINKL